MYSFTGQGVISLKPSDACKKHSIWPSSTKNCPSFSAAQLVRLCFKSLRSLTTHKRQFQQGSLFLLAVSICVRCLSIYMYSFEPHFAFDRLNFWANTVTKHYYQCVCVCVCMHACMRVCVCAFCVYVPVCECVSVAILWGSGRGWSPPLPKLSLSHPLIYAWMIQNFFIFGVRPRLCYK